MKLPFYQHTHTVTHCARLLSHPLWPNIPKDHLHNYLYSSTGREGYRKRDSRLVILLLLLKKPPMHHHHRDKLILSKLFDNFYTLECIYKGWSSLFHPPFTTTHRNVCPCSCVPLCAAQSERKRTIVIVDSYRGESNGEALKVEHHKINSASATNDYPANATGALPQTSPAAEAQAKATEGRNSRRGAFELGRMEIE